MSDPTARTGAATAAEIAPQPAIRIPFVQPLQTGEELASMEAALRRRRLAGDNAATRSAETRLREALGVAHAYLTPSGTDALELAAILADLQPGDEVILPSFTFTSSANAVVLRGAVPVFVDVRADTLNIGVEQILPAITPKTRAIMVVHYAGVPCDMDPIMDLARAHGFVVIEDAAQALGATYRGRAAGALGHMAAFSFHETKNIHCGEGGAFTCQDHALGRRAEIVREKGTNRAAFFRGEIDKYTWIDIGSSFLPSELNAAFLDAQLSRAEEITAERVRLWNRYDAALRQLHDGDGLLAPQVPQDCAHNAHIYHLRVRTLEQRIALFAHLRANGVQPTSHYVPLHASPAGRKFGRTVGEMTNTDRAGDCLMRLPLWCGMTDGQIDEVVDAIRTGLS